MYVCHLALQLRHLLGQLSLEGLRKAGEQTGGLLHVLFVPHLQGQGHQEGGRGVQLWLMLETSEVWFFFVFAFSWSASAFYFNSKWCKEIWLQSCCILLPFITFPFFSSGVEVVRYDRTNKTAAYSARTYYTRSVCVISTWLWICEACLACCVSRVSAITEYRQLPASCLPDFLYFAWKNQHFYVFIF